VKKLAGIPGKNGEIRGIFTISVEFTRINGNPTRRLSGE
jgi:hypothetical protein